MDLEVLDVEQVPELRLDADGNPLPQKNGKTALIDADTLMFAVCKHLEEVTEVLPAEFYTEEEWKEIVSDEGFNLMDMTLTTVNDAAAFKLASDRLIELLDVTGCVDYELHFTAGRKSFRYDIFPEYKANRTQDITKLPPVGLSELKSAFATMYPDNAFIHYDYEADDAVIAKCSYNRDKYVLCAVDKDVIYSEPGTHFNYYKSTQYNIPMKFVEVDTLTATQHKYIQTLTGDNSDGIAGLHRVGPKTAKKILGDSVNDKELWDKVVEAYEARGYSKADAILTMQLVNMHQVTWDGSKYSLKLWEEPNENDTTA